MLSLALAVVVFVPMIALAGISPLGNQLFSSSPTMTYTNATVWELHNTLAAFSGISLYLILIALALITLGLFIYSTGKWVAASEQ